MSDSLAGGKATVKPDGGHVATDQAPPVSSGRRLRGIDAARAVAVVGMVMVHFGPVSRSVPAADDIAGSLYGLALGRASVLFVMLAGVGVALLVSSRRYKEHPAYVRGQLVLRAALLLPLGLWLQSLDNDVNVILQYYAIYFVLAALIITFPTRWLLAIAAAALVVGPLIYLEGKLLDPALYDGAYKSMVALPGQLIADLLISGAYPLVTWAAPLTFGMWVGRRDLYAPAVRWGLLLGGLAIAVAAGIAASILSAEVGEPGFSHYLHANEPHSQMPLWLAGSIGSSCAVLGGMLLIVDRLPRLAWPLVSVGQLALSVYVAHVLLLTAYPELLQYEEVPAALVSVGVFMAIAAAVCVLWRAALPRGPLEAALAAPWRLIEHNLRSRRERPKKTSSLE